MSIVRGEKWAALLIILGREERRREQSMEDASDTGISLGSGEGYAFQPINRYYAGFSVQQSLKLAWFRKGIGWVGCSCGREDREGSNEW